MIESLESSDQSLDPNTQAPEEGEELSPEQQERRTAQRIEQMINELKKRLAKNHQEIADAQQRFAENQGSEEEIVELQAKGLALQESILSTMGQYADMMRARITAAGVIPMWADVEPGRLISVAA